MTDNAEPETGAETEDVTTIPPTQALINRIAAHDAEAAAIEVEMTKLGLDKKKIKVIVKAQEKAAASAKTLAALMAGAAS